MCTAPVNAIMPGIKLFGELKCGLNGALCRPSKNFVTSYELSCEQPGATELRLSRLTRDNYIVS
jgi:hypothetical protein